MSKFEELIEKRLVQNILLWIVLYLVFVTSVQAENRLLTTLYIISFLAPVVYINNLVILPYFNKNKLLFTGLFFLNALIFTFISVAIINYADNDQFEIEKMVNFFGIMVLTGLFASAVKFAKDSFIRKQKDKEAELKLLKAQLNPHFLFNTLNNLYGLSVLKSDKLPSLMLKLSDLLRYSLYDTKEEEVPLTKEITYLENYISLEKIRLEDKTEITFKKTGIFNTQKIAPMLLIVFVENAFKHLNKEGKSTVKIHVESTDKKLTFTCNNTFDKEEVKKIQLETSKSGIGLQNAKKRLDLIYTNNYRLEIFEKENFYCVSLELNYR